MLKAETLHREAALLSNTLADFTDDDVAGRQPVVERIIELREQWKDVRFEVETGQKRRKEAVSKPTSVPLGMTEAELRVELQKIRVNISKYQGKIAERPDHKKAGEWQAELDRLVGLRDAYDDQLIELKYTA